MERSKVVLMPCGSYEEETVYRAVREGLALLGGLSGFVSQEEKILIKVNLLKGAPPEKAITTHPSVFGALLRCLKEDGYARLTYGDSPAGTTSCESAARESGLIPQAERYGVPMGDFTGGVNVEYPQGRVCKRFLLANEVAGADAVISVCKMKTHALENITGAVKNQYGCIYAARKATGHALYPNSRSFAEMLCDLNLCVRPRLYVMDGVIAMEGNGPASGTPKAMRVLLLSADPVALDSVYAHLIALEAHNVPTCVSGAEFGLGKMEADEITVLTPDGEMTVDEAAARWGDPTFDVKRSRASFWRLRSLLPGTKKHHDRPVVDADKCIACGACQRACPVEGQAVHSGNGQKAVYDYDKCIRCYCCQEMCPVGAITKE